MSDQKKSVKSVLVALRSELEDVVVELMKGDANMFDVAGKVQVVAHRLKEVEDSMAGKQVEPTVAVKHDVKCPYCGKQAEFVDSIEIYKKRSYGMMYLCRPCDAYCGCHPDGKPFGTLANKALRQWRKNAHSHFDSLWKGGGVMSRGDAYKWLSEQMGMDQENCHIGGFDIDNCKKVVQLVCQRLGRKIQT